MKPILFAENSTTFTTNGIGRLSDAISCTVTEERNGLYELEMVYPVTGRHYPDIAIRSVIVVRPYVGASLQPFRVYQITRPINGRVTVRAQHISYDLSKNVAMPFTVSASSSACNASLQGLKSNAVETCPFTFWTDVTTVASYDQKVPETIRSRLGGVEGSVLDQFRGEYEWDGFTVKLHSQRGSDNGVSLRYGKNITDINQDENIAETVTGVVPYWVSYDGEEIVTLPEKAVYAPNAGAYSSKLTEPLDFSEDFEEAPTQQQLRSAAQAYISSHELGVPEVSITVSFVNLADTEEHKGELALLQTVRLCDTVTVQFESLGIDTKAKVVKYEWDVLGEKYKTLTVGSLRSSLARTLNDQNGETESSVAVLKDDLRKNVSRVDQAINDATAWLLSGDGYIVARKDANGNWKDIIALDDLDDPQNVMILNNQGLGGSSDGLSGPFTTAVMSNGTIVASMIKAGILTDLAGKFSLNMTTGALSMADGLFSGTVKGSVVEWGTDAHYARMHWEPFASFASVGTLVIETSPNKYLVNDIIEIKGMTEVAGSLVVTKRKYADDSLSSGLLSAVSIDVTGYTDASSSFTPGHLYVKGETTTEGNISSTGSLTVGNGASVTGGVSATGNISAGGSLSAGSGLSVTGAISATGNISTTGGNVSANGNLTVGGKADIHGDLNVMGAITPGTASFKTMAFHMFNNMTEAVELFIDGDFANALEHTATGNFVKWSSSSDRRVKENIKDLERGFLRRFFSQIRPVSFSYKRDEAKKTHYGLIAQELEEVMDGLGMDTDLVGELNDKEKTKYIDYPGLIGICLGAIQELYRTVEYLKEIIIDIGGTDGSNTGNKS